VKLNLDLTVFVGVDLLPGRTYHNGGLRTVDHRLGGGPPRPVLSVQGNAGEIVGVRESAPALFRRLGGAVSPLPRAVAERRQQIFLIVHACHVTANQAEMGAAHKGPA